MIDTLPIALTVGDPCGIGPELTLKAWEAGADERRFYVIGPLDLYRDLGAPAEPITEPSQVHTGALCVIDCPVQTPFSPGTPNPAVAPSVLASIDTAIAHVRDRRAAAIVTNPIAKDVLVAGVGFGHPGHTEYLAAKDGAARSVMMLAAGDFRVVPLTIHVALARVPQLITAELIETTIAITHEALRRDFGISAPRLAVAGLNPHAGENGLMGKEERDLIGPTLDRLRKAGLDIRGPLSADTMFHPEARALYDAAICMYHDQALIPLKTVGFSEGINITLGLSFVRTSPDHGTAFDIAGKNVADPTSLINAIETARRIARQRHGG